MPHGLIGHHGQHVLIRVVHVESEQEREFVYPLSPLVPVKGK